jgi:aspartate/methionine/tyrosine aminotransferase
MVPSFLADIRTEAAEAPASGIVEVFNYGRGRPGLIPLWVGEGDMATPAFIRNAASRALEDGETFYTHQRGIPEFRAAISGYMSRLYGRPLPPERFFATIGGMHALTIALRIIAGTGDEVLVPSPAWPNFVGAAIATGARPVEVPLGLSSNGPEGRWSIDIGALSDAVTPRTRAILVNSPANPTGWTASREELAAILGLARRHGLWIVADEIYGRFVYDGSERAPSFHDVMDPEDRIFFVQTMSKNWAMTGWRVGWLECHPALGDVVENLIQYSSSGVAAFLQRGAAVALNEGEDFVREQVARAKRGRRLVCEGLGASSRIRFTMPAGAFYLFFSVDGEDDTRALALRLVDDANVGLAPGSAFGLGGSRFMRLCFARKDEDIAEAAQRLASALADD